MRVSICFWHHLLYLVMDQNWMEQIRGRESKEMKIQQKMEKCKSDEEPERGKEIVHEDDGETRKDKRRRFGRFILT